MPSGFPAQNPLPGSCVVVVVVVVGFGVVGKPGLGVVVEGSGGSSIMQNLIIKIGFQDYS